MLTFGQKPFPEDAYDGFNFIGIGTDELDDPVAALEEVLPEKADVTFEVAGLEVTFNQAIQVRNL